MEQESDGRELERLMEGARGGGEIINKERQT